MPIFNVPGRGRVQLPEGLKPEDYQAILRGMQMEMGVAPEYSFGQIAGRPIQRTLENIGTSITKELPAMGLSALGYEDKAREFLQEAKQEYAERAERLPRMYQSYEDVTGPLSGLGFAYERIGEALPYGLAMLLPGGAAAAGARGIAARAGTAATEAAIARGLPAAAAESLGAARATQVMQRAGLGGAGIGGYALNAPETFAKIAEETGELRPGVASVAGAGQAILDLVAPSSFLSKLGLFGKLKASEEIAKRAGLKEAAKDLAIAAAKTAPKEGLTEVAQGVISNAAVDFVRGSGDLFSPERIKEYFEQMISGTISGGALGAAGRGIQRIGMPVEQPVEQVAQQAAVVEPQVTQPVVDDTLLKYQIPPAGGITPETVTDQALTPQPSSVGYQVPPETFTETPVDQKYFEQFVADIMAGVPRTTPEDQQFYANNAPVIEQRLREAQAAPALPAPAGEVNIPVPPSETLQLAAPAVAEPVAEQGPPEFVEPPPEEGAAPLPEDVAAAFDIEQELVKQRAEIEKGKGSLWTALKGRISIADIKDATPDPEFRFLAGKQKSKGFKGLDLMVADGDLDAWLPYNLRSEFRAQDPTLAIDGVNHIKDRLASKDLLTEETKQELKQIGLQLDEALSIIRTYENEFKRNLAAAEAAAEGRAEKFESAEKERVVSEQVEQAVPEGEEGVAGPREAPGELEDRKVVTRTVFRTGPSSLSGMDKKISAKDVINYETEELGNEDLEIISDKDLATIPANELAWVTFDRQSAEEYINEEVPEEDRDEITSWKATFEIIAKDSQGGYLIREVSEPVVFTPRSYAEQMMDGTLPDTDEAYDFFVENREAIEKEIERLQKQVVQQSRKGTDAEKKFLDDLVKNNPKLEIAYQDGPLALIRTYGDKYGTIMYLAMNGSRHEYVDVADGTTALLTSQQRAKLIAAKKAIEDAEQKRHDANPFIKFDPSGVTASANVPKELTQVLLGWKNLLKIKPNIYVTTISEAKANREKYTGPHRKIGSAGLNNEYGRMGGMPDGNYFIAFTDGMSTSKMLETLAHELGHIHMYEVFEKADVQTHNEIVREFNKFIRSSKGKDAREFIQSFRPRGIGKVTKGGEGLKAEQLAPYWTSFHEWYADQVSRWATTSAKPLTVVEKFFKRLADALKSFYAKLRNQKYLPNETFKQYLDKVSADSWDITPEKIKPLGSAEQMPLFMSRNIGAATNAGKDMSIDERQDLFSAVDKIDETPAEGMKSMDTMIKDTPSFESAKAKLGQYVKDATSDNAQTLLQFLNLRQIAELAKKDLPQVRQYYDVLNQMLVERDKKLTTASKLREKWDQWADKNPKLGEALDKVILDARMFGIDPTISGQEAKIKSESFRKNWEMIKGTEGEVIFKELRDYYKKQLNDKRAILKRLITTKITDVNERAKSLRELDFEFQKFESEGPYFPLSRFGQYFIAYDIKLPSGETKPYHEMFESMADLRKHEEGIAKDVASGKIINLKSGVDTKELYTEGVIKSAFINKIFAAIDKTDQPTLSDSNGRAMDVKNRLKDDVYQVYLSMLPELSVQKNFIHAKKVAGASLDMRRAFAESAFHSAYNLARMEYGPTLDAIISEAQRYSDSQKGTRNIARDRYLQELKAQHYDFSNPQNVNPIWSKITNFAFLYYLTAPASALGNLIQTPVIGIPTLAGEFDVSYARASKEIFKAFSELRSSRKKGTAQYDLIGMLEKRAKASNSARLLEEAEIMSELEGQTNQTQTLSLAGLAERPSSLYATGIKSIIKSKSLGILDKASMILGYGFNLAEIANRQVTALAVVRLAQSKGMNKSQTIRLAREMIRQIHFEYVKETKARFLRHPIAQVTLQFKNYAQQMTAFIAQAIKESLPNTRELNALLLKSQDKGLSEDERYAAKREYDELTRIKKAARTRLTGVMGMTALFAGYEGLPFYYILEGVMNLIFDDEDEPYDFSLELKVAMANAFGDNVSRALSKGPMSEILQVDVSRFANLNGLWFRDDAMAKDEEEWAKNMLIDMLGPAAGIVLNVAGGIKKINEGNYARGMEEISPPVVKDFFKAWRFYHEGATTLRGDPIVPNVGLWGVFAQSLGFTPQDLQRGYEAMGEIKSLDRQLAQREQRLLSKLFLAYKSGDYEEMDDIGEQIIRYNSKNPGNEIDDKKIKRSFAQRERMSERAEKGIIVSAKRPELLEKTVYLED